MSKKLLVVSVLVFSIISCQKDYSDEGGSNGSAGNVIGANCRISKINNVDSATDVSKGALTATINATDLVASITDFDSLNFTINTTVTPVYLNDTIKINAVEYFVLDATTKRVAKLHRLIDPNNIVSPPIDVTYTYDAAGFLVKKIGVFLGIPAVDVSYTYSGTNLTKMTLTDLTAAGFVVEDATVTYNPTLAPKNFIYIFPDEDEYAQFTQFLDFGKKPTNAISSITTNTYSAPGVLNTTEVSTFSNYVLSRDNYVLSVIMKGNNQATIPAVTGKVKFSYHCL